MLHKVAIVLLRGALGTVAQTRECVDMFACVQRLRHIRVARSQEEHFVQAVLRVDIAEADFRRAHYKELKRMHKERRAASARPART